MFKKIGSILAISLLPTITTVNSYAAVVDITITNLTHAIYFTPLLVAAHADTSDIYTVGTAASDALEKLAEGGDFTDITAALSGASVTSENPNGGPLAPGANVNITNMDTTTYDRLSIVSMMLPTNDGFVGLDSWLIPSIAGTYTIYLNAYDAGTETNNELITSGSGVPDVLGIPLDPGSNSGTGGTGISIVDTNTTVHVHRGAVGDTNATGGESDLNNLVHRWLNPVAKVIITVQ